MIRSMSFRGVYLLVPASLFPYIWISSVICLIFFTGMKWVEKSGADRVYHPSHEQDEPGLVVLYDENKRVIGPEYRNRLFNRG